ncbi:MAG: Nre family DNA repair protein, partial [Candidatus Aenigmatarchaeota archaeon]
MTSTNLCLLCKGSRKLCGRPHCPLLTKIHFKTTAPKVGESLFGPSPSSIFVGHEGYPKVFVGPMVGLENSNLDLADTPEKMYGAAIGKILKFRYSLVRGKMTREISSRDRYVQEMRDLVLTQKPTDLEVNFTKRPKFAQEFSPLVQPMGMSGTVKNLRLTENPKIKTHVYRLSNDELKATDAAIEFYNLDFNISQISKILSSGALGLEKRKKLVPTRWSITAIDDILGKHLISDIKQLPQIGEYLLYENTYLENHFYIILMPGAWEFEQIECWFPNSFWNKAGSTEPQMTSESELFRGRKTYAIEQSGGYYAARFGAAEGLKKLRRQ